MKKEFLTLPCVLSAGSYIAQEKIHAMLPEVRGGDSPFTPKTFDITNPAEATMCALLDFGNEALSSIYSSTGFNYRWGSSITDFIN